MSTPWKGPNSSKPTVPIICDQAAGSPAIVAGPTPGGASATISSVNVWGSAVSGSDSAPSSAAAPSTVARASGVRDAAVMVCSGAA